MLASTMQFSSNDPSPAAQHPRACPRARSPTRATLAPSGPNSVPDPTDHKAPSTPEGSTNTHNRPCRIVNVPPMSNHHRTLACAVASDRHRR
jgi:hypothetical protein